MPRHPYHQKYNMTSCSWNNICQLTLFVPHFFSLPAPNLGRAAAPFTPTPTPSRLLSHAILTLGAAAAAALPSCHSYLLLSKKRQAYPSYNIDNFSLKL